MGFRGVESRRMKRTTNGRKTHQSSRLNGKYSYSISAVSKGLPFGPCCGPAPPVWTPPNDFIPTNCGLCMPSPELDDLFGLRSSSESDKFIGNVAAEEAVRGTALTAGILDAWLAYMLRLLLLLLAPASHEGTGGLGAFGDTASFLFGGRLLLLGAEKGFGVAGQSAVC